MEPASLRMMLSNRDSILIGVIHLPPLPGYPDCPGYEALIEHALEDARALERAGFWGVLVENENDQPHRVLATAETIAAMTRITSVVAGECKGLATGAEILLNDPRASLAVTQAARGQFIRSDYFVDRMSRDEYGGEMAIDPSGLLAYRRQLRAEDVAVFADVQVKYARMLEPCSLQSSASRALAAGADAVVVTGVETGQPPSLAEVTEVASVDEGRCPTFIGSGLTIDNAPQLLRIASGAIIGTGIMTNGKIDYERAARISEVARHLSPRGGR